MPDRDILVVGSVNYDLLVLQARLPVPGETFLADQVREQFGGKGANQAVQVARLGQHVSFVGAIGDDARGAQCADNLRSEGVDCHLIEVPTPTGLGLVQVLPSGDVHATIVRGANGEVTAEVVLALAPLFARAGFVVLQNEVPEGANEAALECAVAAGARVVYNAAPARPSRREWTRRCAYLVLNEQEAAPFLGRHVTDVGEMARCFGELTQACERVVVTMGAAGSVLMTPDEAHIIPAAAVAHVVDTTGAGDSYVGAFVAALNSGRDEQAAARLASQVAAMTVSGIGAQASMPRVQDVTQWFSTSAGS